MSAVAYPTTLDTSRRFVRICGERGQGFVEFEFAIGEPEVFAEMILERSDFLDFCRANNVEMLPPNKDSGLAVSDWDWRMSDATKTRFK
jgi:phenol hydroxylase P0 protein